MGNTPGAWMTWKGLASLLFAVACANPQGATPLPEPPSLNGGLIGAASQKDGGAFGTLATGVEITGQPGATAPRAIVRITNLDNAGVEPMDVEADADGGFSVILEVPEGNELRLQPILGGARGEPIDTLFLEEELQPALRHECLRVNSLQINFSASEGDSASTELENTCDGAATIDSSGTRLGLTEFALGTNLPLVIPAGERATVQIDRDPTASSALEDVLFLEVSVDGERRRLPITLYTPER